MSEDKPNFPFVVEDVPKESLAAIKQHLESELTKDYRTATQKNGRRRYSDSVKNVSLAGEEGAVEVIDGSETFLVETSLPVFDLDGGYSSIRCECQSEMLSLEPLRCWHMWVAQKALAFAIEENSLSSGSDAVLQDFFEDLERLAENQESSGKDLENANEVVQSERIAFLIKDFDRWYPLKQNWHRGKWTKGVELSWSEIKNHGDLLVSQNLGELYRLAINNQQGGNTPPKLWPILKAMASDLIMFHETDMTQALLIKEAAIILKGRIEEDGFLVEPQFESGAEVEQVLNYELAIGLSLSSFTLSFALVKPDLGRFFNKLLNRDLKIPLEDKDRLFQYLSRLGAKLPLSLAGSIDRQEASEQQLYLRLDPLPNETIKIEILCKPSPTSAYFAPGSGPETVLDLSDPDKPVERIRDLWQEADFAQEFLQALHLDSWFWQGNTSFIKEAELLVGLLDRLELSNWRDKIVVEWPQNISFRKEAFEKSLEASDEAISLSIGDKQDWFRVDAKIEIDGETIDVEALLKALRKQKNYVQLRDGRWLKLSEGFKARLAALEQALDVAYGEEEDLHADPYSDALDELAKAEEIVISKAGKEWWATKQKLLRTQRIDDSIPASLEAELRPYQESGFRWLNRLAAVGLGCCLADDMGLGKTLQAITVLTKYADRGAALVIAPLSVQQNWCNEIIRFSPELTPLIYRDAGRSACLEKIGPGDVVIMTYGLVWRDIEALEKFRWHAAIYDEAQNIKNARSKTAKAIQRLNVDWQLALSGTPIENHLGDLWSLFRTLNPALLGSWQKFRSSYGFPISRDQSEQAMDRLNRRVRPFILRRLKKDHLKELPEKTDIVLDVALSSGEKEVYEAIRLDAIGRLESLEESQDEEKQRMQILAALTKLRQAACHPRLVYDMWEHSSSKLQLFLSLAEELKAGGHKALVFSQFTRHLKLLEVELKKQAYRYHYLDGSLDAKSRQRAIDDFQKGGADFFLISLKAGGTGITLTEADYVIHLDPWWNPAIEDQATDRAYRLGQTKPVTVYRLVTKGTIEEEVLKLHQAKRQLAAGVLSGSDKVDALAFSELKSLIVNRPRQSNQQHSNTL